MIQIICTEIPIRFPIRQDMIDTLGEIMTGSYCSPLVSPASSYPMIESPGICPFGPPYRVSRLHQKTAKPAVSFEGFGPSLFTGALIVTGAHPNPGGKVVF